MSKSIDKKRRAVIGGLSTLALAPLLGRAEAAAKGGGAPNILFILADDLGYGDLSGYGRADYETPVLDRLAADQANWIFYDKPHYLLPSDAVGEEAFAVIREAMKGKDMVALARVVLAKRERVVMLQPWEKGLLGMAERGKVLRFEHPGGELPVVATFHPADLLKKPEDKARAWSDLCLARSAHAARR